MMYPIRVFLLAFIIFTIGFVLYSKAMAETGEPRIPEANCVQLSQWVKNDLGQLWTLVERYPNSRARDGIFTTSDYSKPYFEIMKRSSRRVDRTKGIYQELKDRWDYTYPLATSYPWQSSAI